MKLSASKIIAGYLALSLLWFLVSQCFVYFFQDKVFQQISNVTPFFLLLIFAVFVYKLVKINNKTIDEKENDYQNLYLSNPNPLWVYDHETLQFLSVNDAALAFYGYTKEEFLALKITDIRPAEDQDNIIESSRLISNTHYSSGIWRHKKKSGNIIYANITSYKIVFNHKNCVMVLAVDHTSRVVYERKLTQMNQDLNEEKKKLKETEKLAKVSGWEYYVKDGSLIWSDELYEIFDLDHQTEKVDYSLILKSIHQEDLSAYNFAIENLLTSGKSLDLSYRFITKTGKIKYVKVLGKMQYQNGKMFKVLGTMQDITELKIIQQEKNTYQQRLNNTLNNITDGYFFINPDWLITAVNVNFEKLLGLKHENVVNHYYLDVFPIEYSSKFYDHLKKVIENGLPVNFEEYSPERKSWYRLNAYPVDEGAAIYFSDITKTKEKDLQLKEALERYNLVAKATKDVIYDYNLIDDQVNYSSNIINMLNITADKVGNNINWLKTVIHPDDVERVLTIYRKAIEKKHENVSMEYRVHTGSYQYKYVYDQGYLQYDNQNNFLRIIGAIKDIDQLKHFDSENKRLADIITKVNNMIIIKDINHKIIWVNKAFEKFTGYTMCDVVGKTSAQLLNGPETDLATSKAIIDAKHTRKQFSCEIINYTKDQKKYWVNIEFTPLLDTNGLPDGYISIHTNITSQKEKEQRVSRQNQILREIAWMGSHELRRPVASILGLVALINETDDEDERNESIRMMSECTKNLDGIIRNINHRIEQEIAK